MKIRFGINVLQLVANGAGESDGMASFLIDQGELSFGDIEAAVKGGLSSIVLLDDNDGEIQSFTDYDSIDSINKLYNISIGDKIYSDVIKIVLYRSNRDALTEMSSRIDTISQQIENTANYAAQVGNAVQSYQAEAETSASDITDIQVALADVYEMCCSIMDAVSGDDDIIDVADDSATE